MFTSTKFNLVRQAGEDLQRICREQAHSADWWTALETGEDKAATGNFNIPEKLMLIVSEISEAMEGHRKNLQDDKLPQRKMLEVELADAVIRIFDLAGACRMELGTTIAQKLDYNSKREDHKIENRLKEGGKAF
jgi:NTP pyrophosphatase (non-canonical NTP hydrolase)